MGYLCNVVIDRDVGMVVSKDAASFRLDFATKNNFVSSVSEPKIASTAAREQ
jgi:hypothetical protein